VYFFESRFFNGLQPIQTRKFSPTRRQPVLVANGDAATRVGVVMPVAEFAVVGLVIPAIIGLASALSKTMSMGSEILSAAPRA